MSRIKAPADSVSGEVPSWFTDGIFSLCPHVGEGLGTLWVSVLRALIPSWEPHTHDLLTSQRPWGFGFVN